MDTTTNVHVYGTIKESLVAGYPVCVDGFKVAFFRVETGGTLHVSISRVPCTAARWAEEHASAFEVVEGLNVAIRPHGEAVLAVRVPHEQLHVICERRCFFLVRVHGFATLHQGPNRWCTHRHFDVAAAYLHHVGSCCTTGCDFDVDVIEVAGNNVSESGHHDCRHQVSRQRSHFQGFGVSRA